MNYHDRLKRNAEVVNSTIKVAAFNIQIFGTTKYGKPEVVTILSEVYNVTSIYATINVAVKQQ